MNAQIRTRTGRNATDIITESALKILRRDGISRVSLAAVAEEVGVTKAAIQHHFKSKDELLRRSLDSLLLAIARVLHEAADASALIDDVITLAVQHRELLLLAQPHSLQELGSDVGLAVEQAASSLIFALAGEDTEAGRTRARILLAGICTVIGQPECTADSISELRAVGRRILQKEEPGYEPDQLSAPAPAVQS